ncbi:MAG: hypothetical protein ACAI44_02935, partial [Candidatus Sericytochromatia bacterium]
MEARVRADQTRALLQQPSVDPNRPSFRQFQADVFADGGRLSYLEGSNAIRGDIPANTFLVDAGEAHVAPGRAADPKAKAWQHPEFMQMVKDLQAQGIRVAFSFQQGVASTTPLIQVDGKVQPVIVLSMDSPNWHTLVHELAHARDLIQQGGLNSRIVMEQVLGGPMGLSRLEMARSEAQATRAEEAAI